MMIKSKIFITGASSEIMQRFVSLVNADRYELIGLTRSSKDKPKGKVIWVEGDVMDADGLERYVRECPVILHAAAVTRSFHERTYHDVNVTATRRLVELARRHRTRQFVFVSSRSAGHASGAYGASKMLAEECIRAGLQSWLIFRLAEVYGGAKQDALAGLISKAMRKRVVLCPASVPSKFYPIFIDDAARVMHDLLLDAGRQNEVITINGREGYTCRELVDHISALRGRQVKVIPVPKFAMLLLKAVIEHLRVDFGIVPDQIPRLYCHKTQQDLGYDLLTIGEYVRRLATG